MESELTKIIRQSLVGLLEVSLINDIALRVADGLTKRGIEFKEIVKCKDCVGAQE